MKTQYWPSVNIHHLLPLGCLVFLVVTLFSSVLFGDRQFAYRDASQTYYPLTSAFKPNGMRVAGHSG